jgi:nucleotide-binding universal stress UspA family protein
MFQNHDAATFEREYGMGKTPGRRPLMFKTIIWATDGSETADRALPYAKELAGGAGGRLIVVHSKELLVGRAGGHPVLADEDEVEAKIARQVTQLQGEGLDASFRLVSGSAPHAAHMISDTAAEVGADLIVVGTRGHSAVAGLLLGSVTQRLLHIAPCAVLAVPAVAQADGQPQEAAAVASSSA